MQHHLGRRLLWLLITGAVILMLGGMAVAQTGDGYDLSWSTVDGGGATFSAGGSYVLGGAVGQPDAGLLSGSSYALQGGFWSGGARVTATYEVYLPVLIRNAR